MTCDEYRAGVLAGDTSARHADHLASCAACRTGHDSLASAADLLARESLWEEPRGGTEDRIVATIGGQVDAPAAEQRSARARVPIIAAAVVLLVAAAGLVFAIGGGEADAGPDWEVAIFDVGAAGGEGTVLGWNAAAGTRVALDVAGLGPAPDGFVYELWFSAADVHVSGGTFRDTEDVELWVGVSRADYPRIWVTLEPIDADTSPSRQTVLDTRR